MDFDFPASDLLHNEANPPSQSPSASPGELCDICGCPMLDVHCKLICRNCGFMRDCSDP
ncbi:MAG TPA: hypothetical protein VGQ07_08840 [Nitrospirales bacterium]|jgi:hypothetical protein|nr:hypothetical protein [Nitrospirales bacterium]